MAEALVGSLLLKIGSALVIGQVKSTCSILICEARAMHNFFDEMKDIQRELVSIQDFLHEAERFSETDANIKNFVLNIRTVAFDIEDIVDEFTYKLNEQNRGVVAKTIKRVMHVKTWCKLTKMLRNIKTQLVNIHNIKNRYETSGIVKRVEPSEVGTWISAEDAHFKKEGDLLGIDENKKKLMEMLSDDASKQNIISVWGMGGVGKTTLVTHVYNIIKRSFGGCAWIAVSQTWERDQLLRKKLKEFHREDPNGINIDGIETKDFRSLVPIIQKYLPNKTNLLILDDVWTPDVWKFTRGILPEGTAARIIITTRMQDVALAPGQQIMKIDPLGEHHSWDLFCKTAFKKNNINTCPEELTVWAKKIVGRCEGLPLAILAIGGVMACKDQTVREWKRMWEDLKHELAHNQDLRFVNRILQLSFEDLSSILKNCLLYCSIYPEDHEISVVQLTNRWIAEGFVETSGCRTQEEVAEEYLNKLASRCLLQEVDRDVVGIVKSCRMHDIIHSMVVSKSKAEEFCVVHSSSTWSPRGRVRRVSIQNCNLEDARNYEHSLRSICTFNSAISLDSLCRILTSSKLLRVLDLFGTSIEKLPEEVFNLFNLHYLGLDDTGIKELPKFIGRLQNLQCSYALRSKLIELPNELTKLRKLRVLMVDLGSRILDLGNSGLDENSFSCLEKIHSLRILRLTGYKGNELCFHETSFPLLRVLSVDDAPHLQRIEINKGAMPNLETLYISYCPELKELPRGIEYLSKLELLEWDDPDKTFEERVERERTEDQVSEDRMRILRLIKFRRNIILELYGTVLLHIQDQLSILTQKKDQLSIYRRENL